MINIPYQKTPRELPKTIIEKGVSIGAGAIIMGGITIGENSLIGAGALINKNIPKNAVVYGTPGEVNITGDESSLFQSICHA